MNTAQKFIEHAYARKSLERFTPDDLSDQELADPICDHDDLVTRVTAGDLYDGPHASVWVCDREACVQDAINWAITLTRLPVTLHKKDPS
jgi:hypothetical protein